MSKIYKPTEVISRVTGYKVFLAGSIENDTAEMRQDSVSEELLKIPDVNISIFNPRRDNWNPSWQQDIHNAKFKEQVEWELEALEAADQIIMYFDPSTKSPISLLELGLHARSKKMLVCCPEGFWRKGNVDIVCLKYKIPNFDSIQNLLEFFKDYLDIKNSIESKYKI
jgi:hypothetical protein